MQSEKARDYYPQNDREKCKISSYSVVPIHHRPDLFLDCCKLINSEWPSSETRRLHTFSKSCDTFPTCLVLLMDDKVVGHCKVSLIRGSKETCFIETVVIDSTLRYKGLGTILLRETEKYLIDKNIKLIYLTTKGQEKFYLKNGYRISEPINIWDTWNTSDSIENIKNQLEFKFKKCEISCHPPPPPPPLPKVLPIRSPRVTSKTFMIKQL